MWLSGRSVKIKKHIHNTLSTCVTYCHGVLQKQWKKGHSGAIEQETGNTCRSGDSLRFRLSGSGQAKQQTTTPPFFLFSYGASLFLSICDHCQKQLMVQMVWLQRCLMLLLMLLYKMNLISSILEYALDIY